MPMSGDESFLQAIVEDPDDDGLRLVFADWLEERGDPRGEFIRLQCELARLPKSDQRRAPLEARAAELLEQHEEAWLGPLRSWLLDWEFGRGFVERASIRGAILQEHGDELFRLTPLLHLSVQEGREQLSTLAASPYLARLK